MEGKDEGNGNEERFPPSRSDAPPSSSDENRRNGEKEKGRNAEGGRSKANS